MAGGNADYGALEIYFAKFWLLFDIVIWHLMLKI